MRSRIALGIATGIEYLHSLGSNVTHGNIKSSNILLSQYYDAYVSEFGITQLISSTSNSKMIGYSAPEVTDIRNISQKADVYSYGTILLELLTGKNPSSVINDQGIDLPKWVESIFEEMETTQVFDHELIRFQNSNEEQMISLLHLAISCTSQHPKRRPPMTDITRRIKEIFRWVLLMLIFSLKIMGLFISRFNYRDQYIATTLSAISYVTRKLNGPLDWMLSYLLWERGVHSDIKI